MFKVALSIIFALLISGCATTYQKQGLSGGYSEVQLEANVFKVTSRGNGFSGKQRMVDFALLRSAEITLKNGYKYFIVNKSESSPSINKYGDGVVRPVIIYIITLFKEKPEGFSNNAELIRKSLRVSYNLEK